MKKNNTPLQKIITSLLLTVASGILFLVSWLFWGDLEDQGNKAMPFLLAPRLEEYPSQDDYENKAIWIKGKLIGSSRQASLQAPLSQRPCLYYSLEKWQASWEKDRDGDYIKVWYRVNEESNYTGFFYLETLKDKVKIEFSSRGYLDFAGLDATEKIKMIDSKEYKFVEKMLPLQNTVWVYGILSQQMLWPAQNAFLVSHNTAELYLRRITAPLLETAFFLFLLIGFAFLCLVQVVKNFFKTPPQLLVCISDHLFFIIYLLFLGTGWFLLLYQFSILLGLIVLGIALFTAFIYYKTEFKLPNRRIFLSSLILFILTIAGLSLSFYLSYKILLNIDLLNSLLPLLIIGLIVSLVSIHLAVFLKKKTLTHLSYDKLAVKPN